MLGKPVVTRIVRGPSGRVTNLALLVALLLAFATGIGAMATGSPGGRRRLCDRSGARPRIMLRADSAKGPRTRTANKDAHVDAQNPQAEFWASTQKPVGFTYSHKYNMPKAIYLNCLLAQLPNSRLL